MVRRVAPGLEVLKGNFSAIPYYFNESTQESSRLPEMAM